jgi:hypothetical protein
MVNPAYGELSEYRLLGYEMLDNILYVEYAEAYKMPYFTKMISKIRELDSSYNNNVGVDSAYPEVVRALEDEGVGVFPIVFGKELSKMAGYTVMAVRNLWVRIHSIFDKPIGQLNTVKYNEKRHPDKKGFVYA